MSEWLEYTLGEIAQINPTEKMPKGTNAKKIPWYEDETYKGGVKFKNGDTLIAQITPSLENGKTAYVDILEDNEIGFGSTEFIVLREIEDISDLLHHHNKTLEELVQTLFRQLFVAEAEDGWEIGTLDDIMDLNPTHSLKKGGMYPFLEMGNVQTFRSSIAGWYKIAFTLDTKFKNGDTLLARITPSLENGKTAYINFLQNNEIGWKSTEFIVMRMKEGYHPFILYLIARNKDFREFAIGNMTGSTGQQRAQVKDIKEYEISISPIEIIEKLNKVIDPILIKIKANSEQIKTLENMRDTLLPKLMSGEVKVKIQNLEQKS